MERACRRGEAQQLVGAARLETDEIEIGSWTRERHTRESARGDAGGVKEHAVVGHLDAMDRDL
jgi:hypothetical protein